MKEKILSIVIIISLFLVFKHQYEKAFNGLDEMEYFLVPDVGSWEEIKTLSKQIKSLPQKIILYYYRAKHYELLGEYKKAIEDYKECIENQWISSALYYEKGNCEMKSKNYEIARQDFLEAERLAMREWLETPEKLKEVNHWGNPEFDHKEYLNLIRERIVSLEKEHGGKNYLKNKKSNNKWKKTNRLEKDVISQTSFWIDTVLKDGKFLKIYTNHENNQQNLHAEWGNREHEHYTDLKKFENGYLVGKTYFPIKWTTDNAIILVYGCGTNCVYSLIFNIKNEKPYIALTAFYPGMDYANYNTDNENLIVYSCNNEKLNLCIVIEDIESRKKDVMELGNNWIRGVGNLFGIIDELTIKKGILTVKQNPKDSEKEVKKQRKKLELR